MFSRADLNNDQCLQIGEYHFFIILESLVGSKEM